MTSDVDKLFKRLPGSSRHYIDLTTGNELTRAQRDKRAGELERQFGAGKALPQVPAHEFRRVDKSHYLHEPTGKVVGRTQKDKMVGTASAKKPSVGEKTYKPFPEEKKLPESYFNEHRKTHRWYQVDVTPEDEARRRADAKQRFQIGARFDLKDPKTGKPYHGVYGTSSVSYKWWADYKNLVEQAGHSASFKVAAVSTLIITKIYDVNVIRYRYLQRSKRNDQKYVIGDQPKSKMPTKPRGKKR